LIESNSTFLSEETEWNFIFWRSCCITFQ